MDLINGDTFAFHTFSFHDAFHNQNVNTQMLAAGAELPSA